VGKEVAWRKLEPCPSRGPGSYFRAWTLYHVGKGMSMQQQFSHEDTSVLHELDLGQHTLFIMSDGSIDVFANDEQTPYLADNGLHLDSDETYRLFVSLQE
jgi:hypothetical protein